MELTPPGGPPEITPELEREVRRRIASAGGQAFRRSVESLRERAALGDRNAQHRLAAMARIARANGKRGGRPKRGTEATRKESPLATAIGSVRPIGAGGGTKP